MVIQEKDGVPKKSQGTLSHVMYSYLRDTVYINIYLYSLMSYEPRKSFNQLFAGNHEN